MPRNLFRNLRCTVILPELLLDEVRYILSEGDLVGVRDRFGAVVMLPRSQARASFWDGGMNESDDEDEDDEDDDAAGDG